jgi:CheY-like chemotaxis protein
MQTVTETENRQVQQEDQAAREPTPQRQAVQTPSPDVDVLVLEDDPLQLQLLTRHLESLRLRVHGTSTVSAARLALSEHQFRIAILDIHVSDGSGLEVCEYIDSDPKCCGLPVIVLSSHPEIDVVRQCRAAGACFFLSKPYDPNVLLALCEKALGAELE